MSSLSCSPQSPPPAASASPLDVNDLLSEILLRLPPLPSSLPRASAVSKRWRLLVSDSRFRRRFRIHHRGNAPLLGFFHGLSFQPTLESPNRVPPKRLSFQPGRYNPSFRFLGCRHGLVLISDLTRYQFIVWDPSTGDQHQVSVPPRFDPETIPFTGISGSVLRAAGDVHFQVIFVTSFEGRALACVYSSETGLWGDRVLTPNPIDVGPEYFLQLFVNKVYTGPVVLVGSSLYWISTYIVGRERLLEFDLQKQTLTFIQAPVDICADLHNFMVIRADGGGLGFLFISDFTAKLWKRKIDCNGVASWVLEKTIELDKLFSLNPGSSLIMIQGYAEENNVVVLWAVTTEVYELELQSLQFKPIKTGIATEHHPFEGVYTPETKIGGEHDGAELLHNA